MNFVLDSNVFVSSFLSAKRGGAAYDLFGAISKTGSQIYVSDFILTEIYRVLNYDRVKNSYGYTDKDIAKYVGLILSMVTVVKDLPEIDVVRDKDDNPVLATAIKAQASYLVTRDKDLLVLNPYNQIKIITPEECHEVLRNL